MTTHNTPADAANTAVRAFLTKVGQEYLGRTFNKQQGRGRRDWLRIKDETFGGQCCYCGETREDLQLEHLLMFNRKECGLHIPGNVAPCCPACNERSKTSDKFVDWETHLQNVCGNRGEADQFQTRYQRIFDHIEAEGYPALTDEDWGSIRAIANALYDNTKIELEKALRRWEERV